MAIIWWRVYVEGGKVSTILRFWIRSINNIGLYWIFLILRLNWSCRSRHFRKEMPCSRCSNHVYNSFVSYMAYTSNNSVRMTIFLRFYSCSSTTSHPKRHSYPWLNQPKSHSYTTTLCHRIVYARPDVKPMQTEAMARVPTGLTSDKIKEQELFTTALNRCMLCTWL